MADAVTTVLLERAHEPGGLGRMVSVSAAAHLVFFLIGMLVPSVWPTGQSAVERTVMTISLGGTPGPRSGGMNTIGGRPIQQAITTPEVPRHAMRPPAVAPPEMTMPSPSKTRPTPRTEAKTAPPEARGRTPTKGEVLRSGTAVAETGGTGTGTGLTFGGGGGTGGFLDVGDFCCPEYLGTMVNLIRRNWNSKLGATGSTLMTFTIERDGRLTGVLVERSSGFAALDLEAQRALVLTRQIPALPSAYTNETLTVHLNFTYQR
jgi:TonB family protein